MVIFPKSPICLLVQILKPMESPPDTSLHSFFFFNSDWVNLPLFWEHWAITWHLSNTASFGCVCMCAMHDLEHNFVQECAHAVACFASCFVCTCVLMRAHASTHAENDQRLAGDWGAAKKIEMSSSEVWFLFDVGYLLLSAWALSWPQHSHTSPYLPLLICWPSFSCSSHLDIIFNVHVAVCARGCRNRKTFPIFVTRYYA